MMFLVGVEEPIAANEQLYALDEERDEIVLGDFNIPSVYRYCFVPSNREEWGLSSFPAELIRQLAEVTSGPCWWAHVWQCDKRGSERFRDRVRVGGLQKNGWEVRDNGAIYVAQKRFDGRSMEGFGCSSTPREYGGTLLVRANSLDDAFFFNSPATASFNRMAASWYLYPSKEMLTWLPSAAVSIGYISLDFRDRPGIVLVSGERFPFDAAQAQVFKVRKGEAAAKVWRRG